MKVNSLSEQLLFNTCRIETYNQSSKNIGTGFFFEYMISDKPYPFIITNKHVLNGMEKAAISFTLGRNGDPLIGQRKVVEIDNLPRLWAGHPNKHIDVAVIPLAYVIGKMINTTEFFFKSATLDLVLSQEELEQLDAYEDIVFVGYPNGMWDEENFLPILRKGTTATPVYIDFCGKKVFLIDASVFPGSSGSPVYLYNVGSYFLKDDKIRIGKRIKLLGIISGVYYISDNNEIKQIEIPTSKKLLLAQTKQMIDLGVVFKASTIVETIEIFLESKGIKNQ